MKQGFSGKPGTLTPLLDKQGRPRYQRGLMWYRIPLFDFRADPDDPCTYTDKQENQYRPDNHFETDGGSIPPGLRAIPFAHLDPWNFPRAYPNHDGAYQYGGMYIRYSWEASFKFRLMTRKEVDGIMAEWLLYDDSNWWDRRVILNGLALGSWTVWNSSKATKQKCSRVKDHVDVYDAWGDLIEDNGGVKSC
jgi:hypothetical protein